MRIYRYPPPPVGRRRWPGTCESTRSCCGGRGGSLCRVWREHPFDVIHACNPPDLFFLVGWLFRPRGVVVRLRSARRQPRDPRREARRSAARRPPGAGRGVGRAVSPTRSPTSSSLPNGSYKRLAATAGTGPRRRVRRAQRPAPGGVLARPRPRLRPPRSPLPRRLPGRDGQAGRRGPAGARRGASGARGVRHPAVSRRRRRVSREIADLVAGAGIEDNVLMPGFQTHEEFTPALSTPTSASRPTRQAPSTTSRR